MACVVDENTSLIASIEYLQTQLDEILAKIPTPERCAAIRQKLTVLRDKARAEGDPNATNDSIEFALLCSRNAELRRLVDDKK